MTLNIKYHDVYLQGYNDQCWGYPKLDHAWKKSEKMLQKHYRDGQIKAFLDGKADKPWFFNDEEYEFKIGDIVTHEKLYKHNELFEVVGIRENSLELSGDYSGAYNITQTDWLPLDGTKLYKVKAARTDV